MDRRLYDVIVRPKDFKRMERVFAMASRAGLIEVIRSYSTMSGFIIKGREDVVKELLGPVDALYMRPSEEFTV